MRLIKEMCCNCKFYHKAEERKHEIENDIELHERDYEADCRRYPPKKGDDSYNGALSEAKVIFSACFTYPVVNTENWCGEYKGRNR